MNWERTSRWQSWEQGPAARRLVDLDRRLFLRLSRLRSPHLTGLMRGLTHLADPAGLLALSGLTIAGYGRWPEWMGASVAAGVLATIVVNVLKRWLCRPRPDVAIEGFRAVLHNPDAFAFPSGHTAAAFSTALTVAIHEPLAAPVVLSLAAGVGLSRVFLGAHYPLDVAAGAVLGAVSTLAISGSVALS